MNESSLSWSVESKLRAPRRHVESPPVDGQRFELEKKKAARDGRRGPVKIGSKWRGGGSALLFVYKSVVVQRI
jgi:hypothetical protein